MYVIRYYREMAYIVPEESVEKFDKAHEAGDGWKMATLASIIIDTHENKVTKSRYF